MSIMPGIEKAAPERTETSSGIVRVAKFLADLFFNPLQAFLDLVPHAIGKALVVFEKGIAGFGGDDQPGRHRQAGARHLTQAGALAAEQRLVFSAPSSKR